MHKEQYYPEDILIEKLESGEYGWLDFVNHHSAEWQEEYLLYCKENDFLVGDPSAEEFVISRTGNLNMPSKTEL